MIRVVIGTEDNQFLAQKVLEHSIRKNTSAQVDIRAVAQTGVERKGGTNFGFVRFMIPSLFGFEGKAIYLDADQICLSDIEGLWNSLQPGKAIACVQNAEGNFGGKPVGQHNQTSVMVMDCSKLRDWDPKIMFDKVVPNRTELQPGQIHYRDFMCLAHMDQSSVHELDPRWNHFNVIRNDTKLVHFSHVRSQPWKTPSHECTAQWTAWLRETVDAGHVTRWRVLKEIGAGHLHKAFWPEVLRFGKARTVAKAA